jgi:transcriptional regulator with XRE-family HTH domain
MVLPPMIGRQRVAWNIRRLRVGVGLSQEALAADADVDRSYVGRLERAVENPTVGLLDRLASVLGADISELFRLPKFSETRPKPLQSGRKKATAAAVKRKRKKL